MFIVVIFLINVVQQLGMVLLKINSYCSIFLKILRCHRVLLWHSYSYWFKSMSCFLSLPILFTAFPKRYIATLICSRKTYYTCITQLEEQFLFWVHLNKSYTNEYLVQISNQWLFKLVRVKISQLICAKFYSDRSKTMFPLGNISFL